MFLTGILSWWYGDGFLGRIQMTKKRLVGTADMFSIGLLISTLFQPFRQISAEKISGPVADQFRAFFDKLLSRIIGAVVRSVVIISGVIMLTIVLIFSVIFLLIWLVAPFAPVIGLIMSVIGWVP